MINKNIRLQKEAIQNEQEFLQYSSHELRSPLAVIRANAELLARILQHAPEKEKKVVKRINEAATTMTSIVNSFLWLSRTENAPSGKDKIVLNEIIEEIINDNRYLIKEKPIALRLRLSPYTLSLPKVVCQIVISNLITNAFKHASSGEIIIEQNASILRVINNEQTKENESDNTGFGLGLKLVQRIAARYHWLMKKEQQNGRFLAEIDFKQTD